MLYRLTGMSIMAGPMATVDDVISHESGKSPSVMTLGLYGRVLLRAQPKKTPALKLCRKWHRQRGTPIVKSH